METAGFLQPKFNYSNPKEWDFIYADLKNILTSNLLQCYFNNNYLYGYFRCSLCFQRHNKQSLYNYYRNEHIHVRTTPRRKKNVILSPGIAFSKLQGSPDPNNSILRSTYWIKCQPSQSLVKLSIIL